MAAAIEGLVIDDEARCEHYVSAEDIVAIRFYCCGVWYPCYRCHENCADHPIERWPAEQFDRRAVLCGACKTTLSIKTYLEVDACPHCGARFNPGCAAHHALYFAV